MPTQLRSMRPEDVELCGRICYEAFKGISEKHNFRPDFPAPEPAIDLMRMLLARPDVFNVVAESDGQVIGSNHLWQADAIAAVGPITVDPTAQSKGVGRMLMEAVIEHGKDSRGIRLVQDGFNTASLSLYASLGFDIREPMVLIEGELKGEVPAEIEVRPIREDDYEPCAELCQTVLGVSRLNELRRTPPMPIPFVAVREGRITAYTSAPQLWAMNHAVAESDEDMQAVLLGAGNQSHGPFTVLLPTRQSDLFRWCLQNGMKVIKPLTLMSMGEYQQPSGCYLPSVGY